MKFIKSTKIITVKGTAKRVTHKRRIKISRDLDRIGDKEKDTKGIVSTNYNESVRNTNDYISKLNESDEGKEILESIQKYTLMDYSGINNYMKNPQNFDDLPKDVLDNLKNKVSNIKKFMKNAPKFEGLSFRGLQYHLNDLESKRRWELFIKNIEGSKEIKFSSFLSTTTDKNVALHFAKKQYFGTNIKSCIMTIKTKSGVSIEKLSQVSSEKEILLDNNKIYKITKINKDDPDKIYVQLEEK
jgi:hypothetical protein